MRANLVTRLFALALVLMLPITALAEACALCGKEPESDTYLCADCFLNLLAEKDIAGGLEITGAETGADGNVTLTWRDEANNGPYTVRYELLEHTPVPFGWTEGSSISGNEIVLSRLAPGTSYVFSVLDASGNKAEHVYYAPALENGNEIGAKIRLHTRIVRNEHYMEQTLSAAEIMQDNGASHGIYMKLAYSQLIRTRVYGLDVTVEAPNGFADVVLSGKITLNYGRSEVRAWRFIALDDFFSCLERYYGGVPAGEYLVTMHFDGNPACTATFTVEP